jgi:uncharacterized protein YbaR (Trm112 family)
MPALRDVLTATSSLRSLVRASLATRRNLARHSPRPPDTGLVVDVGGGQAADPRADVVVEKYLADDFERSAARTVDLSRPLVVADGHALPFADGSYAYAIASHVVEHATDPVGFAAELSRVARRGFVQVPSRESEVTFGWDFHPWLIDRDGDTLVFHGRGDAVAPLGDVFHAAMRDSPLFRLWFAEQRDVWHHSVHWSGRLDVRVEGGSEARGTATFDLDATVAELRRLVAAGRVTGPGAAVQDTLRCPADRGVLTRETDELACGSCGRRYPVVGDVPLLLEEAARPAAAARAGSTA